MKQAPITITDAAAQRVKELIEQRAKQTAGIKVGVKSGGCSGLAYVIEYADTISKFDEVVHDKGVTIIIDPKAIMYLLGTIMDYKEEKLKSGFLFVNPNAKGECGCGESFHA